MLTYLDVVDRKENVLDFVHGWARACDEEHEACAARQGGPLPTRLISIGGRAIRLEPTENWHSTPPYITLSYCWGKLDFIQTRTSNLEEYLVEIPQDKLPKTFKDAIRIAQALGVGYLWIDSLCIIQDSAADWRKESCRMSGVYGSSYLNVAASSAIDPSQGCFLKPQYMRGAARRHNYLRTAVRRGICISTQQLLGCGHVFTSHDPCVGSAREATPY